MPKKIVPKLDENGNPLLDEAGNALTEEIDVEDPPTEEERISKLVDERLKEIKGKLDALDTAKKAAEKKAADLEKEKRDAELQRLTDEGKHKEVYEAKLAAEQDRIAALERENIELTRDSQVRGALGAYSFRNENAVEMAFREVVGGLIRDDKGTWVARDGTSVKDHVKAFLTNEDNAFLLKPKVNNGGGGNPPRKGDDDSGKPASLFKMKQEDVLKMAMEGSLPRQK